MWLYVPGMSKDSHSARASADSSSGSRSHSQDINLWVTVSGIAMRRPISWRGWKTRGWVRRLFGTILQPTLAISPAEKWISSLPVSLANPSQSLASEAERKTSDGSGRSSSRSSVISAPHLSSLRTFLGSIEGASDMSSLTFATWGTMRCGVVSGLEMSERLIRESVSSCSDTSREQNLSAGPTGSGWPTPSGMDGLRKGTAVSPAGWEGRRKRKAAEGINLHKPLDVVAAAWRTPTTSIVNQDRGGVQGAKLWPTPDTMPEAPNKRSHRTGAKSLLGYAKDAKWPTPNAMDSSRVSQDADPEQWRRRYEEKRRKGIILQFPLTMAAALWRTPAAQEPGIRADRLEGKVGHRMYDKHTGRLAQHGPAQQAAKGWSTPRAGNPGSRRPGTGGKVLSEQAKKWQTPSASDEKLRGPGSKQGLDAQAKRWPTPRAGDVKQGPSSVAKHLVSGDLMLPDMAALWDTPAAADQQGTTGGNPNRESKGGKKSLRTDARNWGTPRASESKGCGPVGSDAHKHQLKRGYLDAQARQAQADLFGSTGLPDSSSVPSPLSQTTEQLGNTSPEEIPRLNQRFVEWLLSWPIGWTNCDAVVTGSSQFKQLWRCFAWRVWQGFYMRMEKEKEERERQGKLF